MLVNSKCYLKLLRSLAMACVLVLTSTAHAASCDQSWPAWESFKKTFINKEGRVIDASSDVMKTTSEGQAYAMFFALVANDRITFEKLLNWATKNQLQDDMNSHLPGWAWGKKDDGSWGVLDGNSASDADLWMAYALGEAGRLWGNRRYIAYSSLLANRILSGETLEVPGLGLVLLPGPIGFKPSTTSVRLNPSYVPLQLMRWFNARSKDSRWTALLNSSTQLIVKSASNGYAPDWVIYDYDKGFLPDTEKSNIGSYDAIRVYLWAGMLSLDDKDLKTLLDRLKPMARFVESHGSPPESINIMTGEAGNTGSSGFSAAMIPFLQTSGLNKAVEEQLRLIDAQPVVDNHYYDQVLSLYALGWHNNLYRFDASGNLTPHWISTCK